MYSGIQGPNAWLHMRTMCKQIICASVMGYCAVNQLPALVHGYCWTAGTVVNTDFSDLSAGESLPAYYHGATWDGWTIVNHHHA